MHIPDQEKCNWIRAKVETIDPVGGNVASFSRVSSGGNIMSISTGMHHVPVIQEGCKAGPETGTRRFEGIVDAVTHDVYHIAAPRCCFHESALFLTLLGCHSQRCTVLPPQPKYNQKDKLQILDRLAWSEMFELYLAKKYSNAKRFGLEGGETLIPGMKQLIDRAADMGVENVVIGMPHRGGPRGGLGWGLPKGGAGVNKHW